MMFMVYAIYRFVNHKQCRSRCCGRDFEASLDVGETSEPQRRPLSPVRRDGGHLDKQLVNPMHLSVGVAAAGVGEALRVEGKGGGGEREKGVGSEQFVV